MTHISITPAPARTDAYDAAPTQQATITETGVRKYALGLVAGAFSWSMASYAYGFQPESELGLKVTDLTGLAFQLGVLSLLQLQMRTWATGPSRKAAAMLKVERVLLGLAMVWTVIHALVPSARGTLWLGILDVFWPLSMLGMFVIGVKVAFAGQWRGAARFWPLVAESWAVVSVPSMAIFGTTVGDYVGASHLLIGYVTLGLIIAARPHLVLGRR